MRPPAKCHRSLLILGVVATRAATQAGTADASVHPGPLVRRGTPTPSNAETALDQLPSYGDAAIASHRAANGHFEQPGDSQSQLLRHNLKPSRASKVHSNDDSGLTSAGNVTWTSLRERARARSKRMSAHRAAGFDGDRHDLAHHLGSGVYDTGTETIRIDANGGIELVERAHVRMNQDFEGQQAWHQAVFDPSASLIDIDVVSSASTEPVVGQAPVVPIIAPAPVATTPPPPPPPAPVPVVPAAAAPVAASAATVAPPPLAAVAPGSGIGVTPTANVTGEAYNPGPATDPGVMDCAIIMVSTIVLAIAAVLGITVYGFYRRNQDAIALREQQVALQRAARTPTPSASGTASSKNASGTE